MKFDFHTGQDTGTEAWHKKNDETKGCAWVSNFPAMRCLVKGEGGVRATEACPDSCSREHIVVGGPDGSGDKNCCGGGWECSAGGQACSRAIQYHEFLPGQTSR